MIRIKQEEKKVEDLWEEYVKEKSSGSREALIMSYLHLVKYVAGRLAIGLPSYVEVEDLFGAGLLGLMQALDKFDPKRRIKFETYAVPRIRGAMLDELRSQDWFPRSIRKKAKILEQAYADVESKLGRAASDQEIAGYLKIPLADYYDLVNEVCLTTLISLDKEITSCNEGLYAVINETLRTSSAPDPSEVLEDKELKEIVRETVEQLPQKERIVLTLYYYEELTLKEIGEVFGISESRVCQIHTKAIMRLRGRILQYTKAISLKRITSELKKARARKSLRDRIA